MGMMGYALPTELSGDQNDAAQLQAAVRYLRRLPAGSPQQLRAARLLGMDDTLDRVNVSKGIQTLQDQTGALAGHVFDAKSLENSPRLQRGASADE
jgi:hypothetical protein